MAIAELSACMKEKEKKIMRKVKKAAGILLALTLAASLVTGCGGSSSKAQEEKDTLTVAITSFMKSFVGHLVIPQLTNISVPMGGVNAPIVQLKI